MADNPKLDSSYCICESGELDGSAPKISVLDRVNGFQYSSPKSDNFVIDMENFSHASNNKDTNSRISRSVSRKGSVRLGGGGIGGGGDKKNNFNPCTNDRDSNVAASSPRGSSMPEKLSQLSVGTTDLPCSNTQVLHQITVTTSSNMNAPSTEGRCTIRRNSFKRPSLSWTIDPKRVLFFFATLSSMGTILLIYFTLSIGKMGGNDSGLD